MARPVLYRGSFELQSATRRHRCHRYSTTSICDGSPNKMSEQQARMSKWDNWPGCEQCKWMNTHDAYQKCDWDEWWLREGDEKLTTTKIFTVRFLSSAWELSVVAVVVSYKEMTQTHGAHALFATCQCFRQRVMRCYEYKLTKAITTLQSFETKFFWAT